MNILQVNMSLDPVTGGGTVERVEQLHRSFGEMEHVSSRILSLKTGGEAESDRDTDVILLPCLSRRWYLPLPKLFTIWRQVKWADVILLMNHWTFLNALVYWLARISGKAYAVCPAGALPMYGRSQRFKRFYNFCVGRSLIAHADAAIAIAIDESADMEQYGVASERIHHIPNGVRTEDFAFEDDTLFRQHIGLKQGDGYLLFVGRLNGIKGPDLLLEAFVRVSDTFPQLHLAYIGPDGGLLEGLKERARESGLTDRIHFAGYAAGELKSSAIHGASLLVVPSRQEAMSIVALEAAICSTPVILTDQCGFGALSHAGGGLLVEVSDERMAEAIHKLMLDQALRQEMGRKGRELALRDYTWSIAAARHYSIFQSLMEDVA